MSTYKSYSLGGVLGYHSILGRYLQHNYDIRSEGRILITDCTISVSTVRRLVYIVLSTSISLCLLQQTIASSSNR
jgi:hypothetical protein